MLLFWLPLALVAGAPNVIYNKSTPARKNRDRVDPAASPLLLPARAPGVIDPDDVMAEPSVSAGFAARRAEVVAATKRSFEHYKRCLLYTSPSPRDRTRSRMPSSA